MVKELERLRTYFADYSDNYIIIGGTACEVRLESRGIDFRATKDVQLQDFIKLKQCNLGLATLTLPELML